MPSDFLVLRKTGDGDQASAWEPVAIARAVQDERAAVKQGWQGDQARYKAIVWPVLEGSEFDLSPPAEPDITAGEAEGGGLPEDLMELERPELDARALELGVGNPDKLTTKQDVVDAIEALASEGEPGVDE